MTEDAADQLARRLRTPHSAAVAGVVFAVLLGTSYVMIRLTIPADPTADEGWLVALVLMVSVSHSLWIVLLFPAWVAAISVYILSGNLRGGRLSDST